VQEILIAGEAFKMIDGQANAQFFDFFQRTDGGALYQHLSTAQTWVGYLVPQPDAPETGISFSDSWTQFPGNPRGNQNGGCYLFAKKPPDNPSKFITDLLALLAGLNKQFLLAYRYFFWFENIEIGEGANPHAPVYTFSLQP
jgi:hypothetical protein